MQAVLHETLNVISRVRKVISRVRKYIMAYHGYISRMSALGKRGKYKEKVLSRICNQCPRF